MFRKIQEIGIQDRRLYVVIFDPHADGPTVYYLSMRGGGCAAILLFIAALTLAAITFWVLVRGG